jgi:hypothetical protein
MVVPADTTGPRWRWCHHVRVIKPRVWRGKRKRPGIAARPSVVGRKLCLIGNQSLVMPGLVPGIHDFASEQRSKAWMAGASPAMTDQSVSVKT